LRHIWVLALLLATAVPAAHAQDATVHFLSRAQSRAALTQGTAREYYARLQIAEMRAKTGLPLENLTLEGARAEAREAYGAATQDFSADEQGVLREALAKLQPLLQLKAPLYGRTPWSFIKVSANIEGGLPHTRGESIVLSDRFLASMTNRHAQDQSGPRSGLWVLLLHEQTHVLQRHNPALFAPLYTNAFGFREVDIAAPEWLRVRRVINPDAPDVQWIYPIDDGGVRHWVLPDIVLLNLEHPRMPQDFHVVALTAEERAGRWMLADQSQPTAFQDLEGLDAYVRAFPERSELFHPNEIAAVMLSELICGCHMEQPEHPLWGKVKNWAEVALK
jgi:hypothetical protein